MNTLFCLILSLNLSVISTDSLLDARLNTLQQTVQALQQQQRHQTVKYNTLQDSMQVLQQRYMKLESLIENKAEQFQTITNDINANIDFTHKEVQNSKEVLTADISHKSVVVGIIIGVLLLLSAVVWWLLRRSIHKNQTSIQDLKMQSEKLSEQIVNRLSTEVDELQKLGKNVGSEASASVGEVDHSLIKVVADRITFMEMTLFKMDKSVRGYKQLSKSIAQMKDNFLANGYEIVDMLGKDYNDGMKVVANFNDDEELPVGQRVITAVIKPQINYKGQMIQSAQITVSQNIQ